MRSIRSINTHTIHATDRQVQDWRDMKIRKFEVVRRLDCGNELGVLLICDAQHEQVRGGPKEVAYVLSISDQAAFVRDLNTAHEAIVPRPEERIIELLERIESKLHSAEGEDRG